MKLFPFISLIGVLSSASAHGAAEDTRSDSTTILSDQGVKNLGIETVRPSKATFETTVFAIGKISPIPNRRSVISTRFSGRVVQTPPIVGDRVTKGQVLLKVESRQPGSPPPVIDLVAPEGGIISESHVTLGQPVEPAEELMDIVDLSQVWAVANVPESHASKVKIGSKAHIKVISLGDVTFEGELIRMGTEANTNAGTVEAIFLLENPELRLRPNMRTEFSIVTHSRQGVLSIPRKAIQGDAAEPYVFVKDYELKNAFVKSPVITGEKNHAFVEVKSGINRFDDVVTQGSYLLGFSQGGGISLKEALDAAHGHEHNEDGSELTDSQKKAQAAEATGASTAVGSVNWHAPHVIFLIASNCITLALLTVIAIKKNN